MRVGSLDRSLLTEATAVLAASCAFDRADLVADEKLFGGGPNGSPHPFGVWDGERLVGVAAVSANRLRVLAVVPGARRRGAGSALLAVCEDAARVAGETTLRSLDQPGNYLAPGVDARNVATIDWLERRGWKRTADPRENVLIDVRNNPRVSTERAEQLANACRERGYEIRRARRDETALLAAVATEFGGAWPFELARALEHHPAGVHLAIAPRSSSAVKTGDPPYCAFAAHDGNNRGLGWFGPTGTWPAHRGKGLGEALLLACLVDVAADHARCEVAWIGPRPFYEKAAGIAMDRRFVLLVKTL